MNYTLILQAVLLIFAIVGVITVFTATMFYIEKLLSDREDIKERSHFYNKRWKLKKLLEILFVVWLCILSIFGFIILFSIVTGG